MPRFLPTFAPLFVMIAACQFNATVARAESDVVQAAQTIDQLAAREGATGGGSGELTLCRDEVFLRRVFLDLLGRPATQEDILAFCLDEAPDKRAKLVDQLLADDEFGMNWGRYWRDIVMYRRTEDRALLGVTSFTNFLTEQLNANRPWSETARKMITATGDALEHGETGLIVAQAGMPEDVTSEVSRIFLGIQIQCAQCHDHPTDRWKREQFHELAAFFPRVAVRLNVQERTLIVNTIDSESPRRRANNNNRFVGTLEHRMPNLEDPASPGTVMQPAFFLTGERVASGVKDADRRGQLADWVTSPDNSWFATAFVNRMWSELVGQPFYSPVDDLGPDRECSAPETAAYLAKEFTDSEYDVKRFFRLVMATRTYQQGQRTTAGESGTGSASCTQRLRADQLFDSLVTALNLSGRLPEPSAGGGPYSLRRDSRFLFSQVFGYDPSEPRDEVGTSVPQALLMMNSAFIQQSISASRRDLLGGVLARNPENEPALVEIYLNTLGRAPSERETQTCLRYIARVDNRAEAFEDILWSLVNSTEFGYRK